MNRLYSAVCSFVAISALAGCASPKTYSTVQQPTGTELRADLSTVMLRETRTGDLPNAFGNADVFGRKVDKGSRSIFYQGLRDDGSVVLRVVTIDVASNETTMNRTAMSMTTASAYRVGNQAYGSALTTHSTPGKTESLPPNAADLVVRPPWPALVEWGGHQLEIRSASPASVTYIIK